MKLNFCLIFLFAQSRLIFLNMSRFFIIKFLQLWVRLPHFFMFLFNLASAERPQHCALVLASLNFDSFRGTNHTVSCWYGPCSYGLLCENRALYAGKILIWRNFGHLIPKFVHFWPKLTVLRVLTYNFQMQIWLLTWIWLFPGNQSCWTISSKRRYKFS